jgi:hypothetical protein
MSAEKRAKLREYLIELALKFFKKEGYKLKREKVILEGYSGILRRFDLIVQKGRREQGVWIREWNRTIGVNVIIGLDTASEDVGLSNPIMIGGKFSDHAKSYSNRRKIMLLTKQKMAMSLR